MYMVVKRTRGQFFSIGAHVFVQEVDVCGFVILLIINYVLPLIQYF